MGTLAHVLEAQGLATVVLSAVRGLTERLQPPRALHCAFPLGRPLGRPGDPVFQRRVLEAAFALLQAPAGPVLVDFPETIGDAVEAPLACPVPPRLDPTLPPAVDEVLGLRAAYERQRAATGRTMVGRGVAVEQMAAAVGAFVRIAAGVPWEVAWQQAGLAAPPPQVQSDVRAYYEEVALVLVDHVPAARAAETWFYQHTETGRVLRRVQRVLRAAGYADWFIFLPAAQSDEPLDTA